MAPTQRNPRKVYVICLRAFSSSHYYGFLGSSQHFIAITVLQSSSNAPPSNAGGNQPSNNGRSRPVRGVSAAALGVFGSGPSLDGDVEMDEGVSGSSSSVPPGVRDIDNENAKEPLCVPEYVSQIFSHYREDEVRHVFVKLSCLRALSVVIVGVDGIYDMHVSNTLTQVKKVANHRYMGSQEDINERMRAILIDWLIEVHLKFKLMPETLYLTVNLIDRYLENNTVVRQKLQLVGVTAMLLASKYEEIYAPEVRDFVYITDRAYTREQILSMETSMLQSFSFNITTPTGYPFLKRFLKAAETNTRLTQMATYFMERTLQEYRMLQFLPSMIAASAVNMAMRSLDHGSWNATLEYYTGYTEDQLRPCIQTMEGIIAHAPSSSLKAVYKKWSSTKFGAVARIPMISMQPTN